jgi:hypothetical protein
MRGAAGRPRGAARSVRLSVADRSISRSSSATKISRPAARQHPFWAGLRRRRQKAEHQADRGLPPRLLLQGGGGDLVLSHGPSSVCCWRALRRQGRALPLDPQPTTSKHIEMSRFCGPDARDPLGARWQLAVQVLSLPPRPLKSEKKSLGRAAPPPGPLCGADEMCSSPNSK